MAAALGCALSAGSAAAQPDAARPRRSPAAIVAAYVTKHPQSAETIRFGRAGWSPVKVVRGGGWSPASASPSPSAPAAVELITFADPRAKPVRVLRGEGETNGAAEGDAGRPSSATVRFADRAAMPVTVIRGPALAAAAFDLFAPASAADLDRVAFAVDGIESSHGLDPAMWRPDPAGPQGPMQVSLAAALDVGGGDRFDLAQNRALGRAYLARLYRRYGNWADALAAYNWGPAHVDLWIADGRLAGRLPLDVARYRDRILGEVGLVHAGPGP